MLARYGRYETLRKIASGGMATVYLGRVSGEGGFERLVALKVMHEHIAGDPEFEAMFLDEARLAARIRHPNVVATIDIQKTEAATFLVMDYVDGPSLQVIRRHFAQRDKRLPVEVALRLFIDVLAGLRAAHDLTDSRGNPLNLVHRDVSPHNILVGQDGVARLTDFGVARAEERITTTRGGQLKGKIAYMAPEQILSEPVTRRADIYATGVCLWEAIVGRRMFKAANEGAMLREILEAKVPWPSRHAPCPASIERVILRALAKRPAERYAEALDMADALETAALEAGMRIPRVRHVAELIRSVVDEIGPAALGASDRLAATPSVARESGVSKPSALHFGSGPSHPRTPALDDPVGLPSRAHEEMEIGSTPSSMRSEVTSPTATSAAYSLPPQASRGRRVLALMLAATGLVIALGVLAVLMVHRNDPKASAASPALTALAPPASQVGSPDEAPSPSSPLPPEGQLAEEEGSEEITVHGEEGEATAARGEGGAGEKKQDAVETSKPAPRRAPRVFRPPPRPEPEPAPTEFRPTEL